MLVRLVAVKDGWKFSSSIEVHHDHADAGMSSTTKPSIRGQLKVNQCHFSYVKMNHWYGKLPCCHQWWQWLWCRQNDSFGLHQSLQCAVDPTYQQHPQTYSLSAFEKQENFTSAHVKPSRTTTNSKELSCFVTGLSQTERQIVRTDFTVSCAISNLQVNLNYLMSALWLVGQTNYQFQ